MSLFYVARSSGCSAVSDYYYMDISSKTRSNYHESSTIQRNDTAFLLNLRSKLPPVGRKKPKELLK